MLTTVLKFVIIIFGIFELILLVLWTQRPDRTRASIASATLKLSDAVIFGFLSYVEHAKSIRTSALLNSYLFFSIAFDISQVRTLWLKSYYEPIVVIFTTTLALKALILFLEALGKYRYLSSQDQERSPEETAGVFNQSLFIWLNRLIVTGFRKALLMDDLYPISKHMLSEDLLSGFENHWVICKF